MYRHRFAVVILAALSACATRTPVVVMAPLPSPVAVVPAPVLPAGASPGMAVPAMRADGSFATPNVGLTSAATVWHLRAGLNVAALACRADETTTVARYNALLAANRIALTAAETAYAAEFRAAGGDWRDRYDDAMTRLYNYWSIAPARGAFCAAATQILIDAQGLSPGGLETFATARLPDLDRAFTDFYRAYDLWRRAAAPSLTSSPMVIAAVAPVPAPPAIRIEVDPAALFDDRLASR